MDNTRFDKGMAMLAKIDGIGGQEVVNCLEGIAPDFGRYLVEFPFGDIYSRPGLDLKSREIATVAALTALGYARPQLKVHIAAAVQKGGSYRDNYPVGGLCRLPGRTQWSFSRQGGVWESARHILIDWHF